VDRFTEFHLFSFLPVLAFGAVICYERWQRHGTQKRTVYLFYSLVALALAGLLQAVTWVLREPFPDTWPQVFVLSGILYFLALIFLEYAIHVKRIEESFLSVDFRREMRALRIWFALAGVLALSVLVGVPLWGWEPRLLAGLYTAVLLVVTFLAAQKVFNLQEGVIRQRGYPFYAQMAVTVVLLGSVLATGGFPLFLFDLLNLVYIIRLVEEFFLWSQYNLRMERAKMEQRQHLQNLLIRRVIGAADADDCTIIREMMENALEKGRARMVVQEYQMTGMSVHRAVGKVLRVEDPGHLLGYCTPLTDSKTIKSLDKQKLNDLVLRTTYSLSELNETERDNLKDWGKKLVKDALTTGQIVVSSDLPEGLRGLQRLVVLVPIYDGSNFMGFLTVFKDSFDRLYQAEREILAELAESLGTVYALMAGKEVQRERNRLQGEMNTAREIQVSILPKKIQLPGFQVGTFMEPATEVGGDVFDFIPTPYGTYFGIGDVAGHGLPAGMMAVISVAALHGALDASKVLGQPLPLDQVYDGVNRVLCTLNRDRIGSDKFMTQNYFRAVGGTIDHVGTHLVAALWRASGQHIDELTDLTNKTGFMGLSEWIVSSQSVGSFTMETGDVLVLYSDGVSEAMNGNGTMFGLDGIKNVLAEHADETPDELIAHLLESLRHHAATGDLKKHGGHFTDDVSLVVLKKD